jgi:hypothetical protein
MAISIDLHAELVARRHQLVAEIESRLVQLCETNAELAKAAETKPLTKPGTVKHAALAAVRSGRCYLLDITEFVSIDMGRAVVKNQVANELRVLRSQGILLHADRRWYLAEPGLSGQFSDR